VELHLTTTSPVSRLSPVTPATPARATDLMSGPPISVGPDATLGTVRQVLTGHGVQHVLVVEDSVLRGVVSDREVLRALSPYLDTASEQARDLQTLRRPVHQVMDHHPVTVRPEADLDEVARLFTTHRLTWLPVVEPSGHPLGAIAWHDLLAHLVPSVRPEASVPASRTPAH
jgi:acetoin utilization protein AcuB